VLDGVKNWSCHVTFVDAQNVVEDGLNPVHMRC
jgi:hypothetical protein